MSSQGVVQLKQDRLLDMGWVPRNVASQELFSIGVFEPNLLFFL